MAEKKQALTPMTEVRKNLSRMEPQFQMALPPHIPMERFLRVANTALQTSPKLCELDRHSLYGAFMESAQQGLLPDGREAAIVPFKGKAKFMPMVAGICLKVRQSGELKTIGAEVVCENDEYDRWIDETGEHFKHRKARKDRGEDVLTYAYAMTKDGGFYFEEIDEDQMKAIEKSSQTDKVWKGPFRAEMKKKSAIRRLCKYRLPMSTDLNRTIRSDDEMYSFDSTEKEAEPQAEKPPSRVEKIVAEVANQPADDMPI